MTVNLTFTNNKTIDTFLTFSKLEREKIIEIGIDIFQYLKKQKLSDDQFQTLLEKEKQLFLEKSEKLEHEFETKLNQSIKIYKDEKSEIETQLLNNNSTQRDYWLKREEEIRGQYQTLLTQAQAKYESTFLHTQNSTILGQDGENFTLQKLNMLFPTAEIEDCHAENGRGDFILHDSDFHMMIETKNYTKNVLKNEITKFYRDVDNNNDIQCAILVSLKSGICAKNDFHLEVRKNKPILFLHKVSESISNIRIAVKFFKLILNNDINLNQKEIVEKIKNIIPVMKRIFRKQKKQIFTFKKNMDQSIIELENSIVELFKLISVKY